MSERTYFPKISFLGCWDTVDAFVLPSRFPKNKRIDKFFHALKKISIPKLFKERFRGDENRIPESVLKAVHCVAIDETRDAFLPTLMPDAENVEEVWFPGVHSDVGGGYDDNMIADESYEFMKKKLIEAANIKGHQLFKTTERKNNSQGYCFHFHGMSTGLFKKFKNIVGLGTAMRRIRVLDARNPDVKPKIHISLNRVKNSNLVFAANPKNKRTWTITYDPYNVKELKDWFEIVE
jgi:hypothetical protein